MTLLAAHRVSLTRCGDEIISKANATSSGKLYLTHECVFDLGHELAMQVDDVYDVRTKNFSQRKVLEAKVSTRNLISGDSPGSGVGLLFVLLTHKSSNEAFIEAKCFEEKFLLPSLASPRRFLQQKISNRKKKASSARGNFRARKT
jgi:hypothetical protein